MPNEVAPSEPAPSAQPAPDLATPGATHPVAPGEAGSGADSAPATSTAPEGPPKPKDIGSFAARRHKLNERAKTVQAQAREVERREAALAEREKSAEARITALERELAEQREAAKGNPLLKPGVDAEAHIRELLAAGTPEAKLLAAESLAREAKERADALEKRLEDAEKKRTEDERKANEASQAQREEAAIQSFSRWATAGEGAKGLPFLNAEFSPREVQALVRELHENAKRAVWTDRNTGQRRVGVSYTGDEVAKALEAHAKRVHDDRQERRKALGSGGPQPPPAPAPRDKAPPGRGPRASGQAPRVEAPPVKPQIARRLSREQEEAEDLAKLRQATAADRAEANRRQKPAPH